MSVSVQGAGAVCNGLNVHSVLMLYTAEGLGCSCIY